MLMCVGIYLAGMFLGFLEAAREKDKEWNETDSVWVPYFLTFGWPLALLVLLVCGFNNLYGRCPNIFFWLLNKTSAAMKWRPKPSTKRIVVAIPSPAVVEQYRYPGPHPCIACGTPTSVDQSSMQVVAADDRFVTGRK